MRRAVVYVDGSTVTDSTSAKEALGWGVVASHDDGLHERFGGVHHVRRGPLTGCHEHVAFFEAVRYALDQGLALGAVTFLCDDAMFGYAQVALHPGNFRTTQAQAVRERVKLVADRLYDNGLAERVLHVLEHGLVHKLKGHSLMVHQERADYLAKWGARQRLANTESAESPMPFERWLSEGMCTYDESAQAVVPWTPPFVVPKAT